MKYLSLLAALLLSGCYIDEDEVARRKAACERWPGHEAKFYVSGTGPDIGQVIAMKCVQVHKEK